MSIWPPLIYLGILFLTLGRALTRHGEEGKGSKENFYTTLVASALIVALLWWGHFFDPLFHRT